MTDLLDKLKNPESQERKIILMITESELESIFDDFFDTYNVTEKDKSELLARLASWKIQDFILDH
jgi:hypothetical protein